MTTVVAPKIPACRELPQKRHRSTHVATEWVPKMPTTHRTYLICPFACHCSKCALTRRVVPSVEISAAGRSLETRRPSSTAEDSPDLSFVRAKLCPPNASN